MGVVQKAVKTRKKQRARSGKEGRVKLRDQLLGKTEQPHKARRHKELERPRVENSESITTTKSSPNRTVGSSQLF